MGKARGLVAPPQQRWSAVSLRDQIVVRLAAATRKPDSVEFSPEEVKELLQIAHDLGRHEARAIKDSKVIAKQTQQIAEAKKEGDDLARAVGNRLVAVRDSFIAAALSAGKEAEDAVALADRAMSLRRSERVSLTVGEPQGGNSQ